MIRNRARLADSEDIYRPLQWSSSEVCASLNWMTFDRDIWNAGSSCS